MVDPFHGPTLPDMRIEVRATPVTAPLLRPSSDGRSRAVAERLMGRCLAVEVGHVGARVTVVGLRDVIDGRSVPALERRLAGAVRRGQRMRLGFCMICSPSSSLIDGGWTPCCDCRLGSWRPAAGLTCATPSTSVVRLLHEADRTTSPPSAGGAGVERCAASDLGEGSIGGRWVGGQDGPLRVRPGCGRAVSVDRERE